MEILNFKKTILLALSLGLSTTVLAQTIMWYTDNANRGQLKRMVATKWNDWRPDPSTNWLGWPRNPIGYAYWRWTHHSYFKGPDRRPYRAGGPFPKNYASLVLQSKDDEKIADSIYHVFKTNLATFTSMSGGTADLAWQIYFRKKFEGLFSEIPDNLYLLSVKNPEAFLKYVNSKEYEKFQNYFEMAHDRVLAIHKSLMDKGSRIIRYMKIMDRLEKKNSRIKSILNDYYRLTKYSATPKEIQDKYHEYPHYNNDKDIVTHILTNYHF